MDTYREVNEENELALWLFEQQQKLENGTLSEEHRAALDEALPGWEKADTGLGRA